jgi:Na+/melibiose symporter-like transporter
MSRALPHSFRLLWAATGVSNLGDGIRQAALPLAAVSITDDPRLIAGVAVAQRLPWLLLILPGGVLADRLDRRRLRVTLDIVRAVAMGGFAIVAATGSLDIWLVYLLAIVLSSAESIVDSSSMALVPSLVSDAELERAASVLTSTELVTNDLVGPPLGGLLFAAAIAAPFATDSVSFFVAALLGMRIAGSFRAAPRAGSRASASSVRQDIAEGVRWLWHRPMLRDLALISTGLGTFVYVANAVLVLFAVRNLGLGNFGFGLFLIPGALGGVAGSIVAPHLRRYRLRPVLVIAIAISGISYAAMAVQTHVVPAAVLLAVTVGGAMVWNVLTLALRQRWIPDELLGRVGASYRLLVYVGMPLGAFAGGWLADALSVKAAIMIGGLGLVAMAIVTTFIPLDGGPRETPKRSTHDVVS